MALRGVQVFVADILLTKGEKSRKKEKSQSR